MMLSASSSSSFSQVGDVRLDVRLERRVELHLLQFLFVPLKELDGVPAQARAVDLAGDGFLDVGDGVLDAAVKTCGCSPTFFSCAAATAAFAASMLPWPLSALISTTWQPSSWPSLTMSILSPFLRTRSIMLMATTTGMPQLDQLRGQVQVALDVRSVHDVEDRVRPLLDQVAARHDLLERIGRQGIDARQVLDDDVLVPP